MNKGTRTTTIRIPDPLREAVMVYLERRARRGQESPWTLTDLINHALKEFLEKRVRGGNRSIDEETGGAYREVELPTENGQRTGRNGGGTPR